MQCEQFEERLNQLLDRRLPPEADDALLSHAHLCNECREVLDAQQTLFQTLDALESPETSPDFGQRVVRQVVSRRRARYWRRAAYFLGGLAAGIVVAIWVLPRGHEHDPRIVDQSNPSEERGAAPPVSPEDNSVPREPETAVAIAMENAANTTPSAVSYAEWMEALKLQQEQLAAAQKDGDRYLLALEDWGSKLVAMPNAPLKPDSLPGGIKPLAESISAALELFQSSPDDSPPAERPQAQLAAPSLDAIG